MRQQLRIALRPVVRMACLVCLLCLSGLSASCAPDPVLVERGPFAFAGFDRTADIGRPLVLDGSGSYDVGEIETYEGYIE